MIFAISTPLARLPVAAALALGCAGAASAEGAVTESYGGRDIIVYAPSHLPASGARALVIVMHGGLGNAQRIEDKRSENGMNLDALAEANSFIVAYLNGTPVTRRLGDDKLGWNAGNCCGQSAANNIDDVGYIAGAVDYLAGRYGIDRARVFGLGHSNGGMMAQRLMCESQVLAAAVPISGPLGLEVATCPAAKGKRLLAIHGVDDANVPVAGGRGTKGLSDTDFKSEAWSQQVFMASGASYELDLVQGADHFLAHIDDAVQNAEGQSVAEKAARFFGLMEAKH